MGQPKGHSPLGASGASRWLPSPYGGGCTGSVTLSEGIKEVYDDGEFSAPGQAAHALAEICLVKGSDAWQRLGYEMPTEHGDIEVDKDMADAVQVYLAAIRQAHPNAYEDNSWVEQQFHCPSLHEYFWGMADFVYLDRQERVLHVWDYKHGAGIIVEVPDNPQCMYYGCGILESLDLWTLVDTVVLHIAQPRGWHPDGAIREWSISTTKLERWLDDILIPGMDNALGSRDTKSGEHCRFCNARGRKCPQIVADFEEMEKIMEAMDAAKEIPNAMLGRFMDLFDVAKIANKAYGKLAYTRAMANNPVPGRKLVSARSNRAFREGAEDAAKAAFGKKAQTTTVLKSPAEIDKLPGGKAFSAEWASKPDTGLCVVRSDDKRVAVSKDTKSMFTDVTKKGK